MAPWSLHVTVSYTLAEDADLEETLAGIRAFVATVAQSHPGIRYVSGQAMDNPRVFRHAVRVRAKEDLVAMQAEPFFKEFGPWLGGRCAEGPTVQRYKVVAATP
jgi:hypothetical protein